MQKPKHRKKGRKTSPNGLHLGDADPLSSAINRRDADVMNMVKEALRHNQAVLAFQPVVLSKSSNKVAFYEGLIRILDATGRPIPAKDFIHTVEDSETGRIIDCLSLELGMKALMAEPTLRLSINMSARSVGYRRWMQTLETGLAQDDTIAERLIMEITESSAMATPELVVSFMNDLQGKGISFALDDFGAGYTSFRYLRDFYFDILKIDGQFTKNIAADRNNQVLVEALVMIGRQFEMFTVAENVETEQDARILQSMGIDCLQGYYFGAPSINPYWTQSNQAAAI